VGATGATGATGAGGSAGYSSLILLTAEPVGTNCGEAGIRVDVGLDNGDGNGIERNGILEGDEVDQTMFLCPPPMHI
jgi:hypothetical protein